MASWQLRLEPTQTELIAITVEPRAAGSSPPERSFDMVMHDLRRSYESWERACTRVWTDNELYNSLLSRGLRDLRALLTPTRHGSLVAAGIPWFVAPFGRDSLLTCHQTLMLNPDLTRTTLEVLAAFQADEVDEWRDAQPGKILHELRQGELAGAGIIPHTPYYGSIDSTPLWLLLLGTYYRWTGDLEFCRDLLPNIERALAWIADYGDLDGDGFLEYQRSSPRGLVNQGWKDSHDSVVHVDGKLAEGPIALAEVQAYVYLAKQRMAEVFEALGNAPRAASLRQEAAELRAAFNERFWVESEQFYAMALDGEKRQVASISSNPAHGLYCGIVDPDMAGPMARRLLAPDMFSGWGVRTLSKSAAAYNPMSYHNGSIWPHDNAIIGAGLKRYGFAKATNRLATAMFEMAVTVDDMRLPELFCGFTRRSPEPAGGLPGRLLAPGVGRRGPVPAPAGDARDLGRRPGQHHQREQAAPARLAQHRRAARPADRRLDGVDRVPAPGRDDRVLAARQGRRRPRADGGMTPVALLPPRLVQCETSQSLANSVDAPALSAHSSAISAIPARLASGGNHQFRSSSRPGHVIGRQPLAVCGSCRAARPRRREQD